SPTRRELGRKGIRRVADSTISCCVFDCSLALGVESFFESPNDYPHGYPDEPQNFQQVPIETGATDPTGLTLVIFKTRVVRQRIEERVEDRMVLREFLLEGIAMDLCDPLAPRAHRQKICHWVVLFFIHFHRHKDDVTLPVQGRTVRDRSNTKPIAKCLVRL